MSEEQLQSPQPQKKESVRKLTPEQMKSIGSYKSYWPLALALALVILLIGIVSNSIVIGVVGVVVTATAIVGWGIEKR